MQQFFTFATLAEKLKKIERFKGQFYWRDYPKLPRYESVADHTWRLCLLIVLFESRLSQKINLEKALKMAIIHDLPEIIAGDASPMGNDGTGKNSYAYKKGEKTKRRKKENIAARKIFGSLPKKESHELYNLWLEYEEECSFEARVVKALDRIECELQVLEYRKGHMFKNHLEFTFTYGFEKANIDPAIAAFGEYIKAELNRLYKEFP